MFEVSVNHESYREEERHAMDYQRRIEPRASEQRDRNQASSIQPARRPEASIFESSRRAEVVHH